MKILVAVKRVIDPNSSIHVVADESGVDKKHAKMAMNPFDEIALEAAIQCFEKNIASEVIAVSIGDTTTQETLRHALALGAHRAIHVVSEQSLAPINIARILAKVAQTIDARLIMLGKQAIDDDCNQTGQMLAGRLGWGQATFASHIQFSDDQTAATVTREIDGGLETIQVNLPAVITTDLRLNEPRYASLPNIMKSKQKEITKMPESAFADLITNNVQPCAVTAPPKRPAGIKVNNVDELIDCLKNNEKVI